MKSKWLWLVPILALLALAVGFVLANSSAPPDKVLIRAALNQSIQASREGNPVGVLQQLSRSFKVNDLSGSPMDIAKFIRDNRPDIEIPEPSDAEIVINESEGTARLVTPVKIKMLSMGATLNEVTIIFRKEDSFKWFVIPSRQWKVIQVYAPENQIPEFGT
jgi:hypothetical protein